VKCPNCHRENDPAARFCIFCATPLLAPEAEGPQEQSELQEEVRRLRELVIAMHNRLAALENMQGITAPAPPPTKPTVLEPSQKEALTTLAAPTPPPPREVAPRKPTEWEMILGGSWLARVGVIALIIGAGFFLKYAFDQNWLGPTARVIIGIVAGLVMLGLGYYWQKRYPILTRVLSGGGIAILYLSIFASFAIYDLVNFYVACAFLLVVSIASALLALRYNSMALAIIGIIGAFMAPFILGGFGARGLEASEASQAIQLLAYIIVVNIGVLILSTFRDWRWFTLLALFGSLITFGVWYGEFERDISLATAEIGITIIFLIFVGATTLFHFIWRRTPQAFDFTLMMFNAAAYLGISLGLMWDTYREWMGGFVFLLALFYGALAYVAFKRSEESARFGSFALGIALIFLTVAIPIQLGDKAWTTIAWAVQGTVLMWLATKFQISQFRYSSYALFAVTAIRLLFFDTTVDLRNFQPIINERFLAFAVSIATMYLTFYLLWRSREAIKEWATAAPAFLVAANFFTLWVLSFEVWDSLGTQGASSSAQNLSLTAVWAFYAIVLLVIGIVKRWRLVRLWALGLLIVPIVKVFIYDVWALETIYRIVAFVGLGLLLLISAYIYQRYSQVIKGVFTKK
jgi:uncharacterized membrane protein